MTNVAKLEDARVSENFLKEFFIQKPAKSSILIWTLHNKKSHWFETIPAQSTLNTIATSDTFFGLGIAPTGLSTRVRCLQDSVIGIPGLWLDIDFKSKYHKKADFLPEEQQAYDLTIEGLALLNVTPTHITRSGNGFHFYVLFDTPWMFETEDDRLRALISSQKLSQHIKAHHYSAGFQTDSVFDLARVLRLPGTYNHKGDKPVLVTVECNHHRYKKEELINALQNTQLDVPAKKKDTRKSLTQLAADRTGIHLNGTAEVSLDKYEALAANEPNFMQVWERKKKLKDTSPSGYDMSLACYAAVANWSDQEIVDLLIHHRRKHGSDLKIERLDYYRATIAKARRIVGKSAAMNELEEIHDDSEKTPVSGKQEILDRKITEQQRANILQLLSEVLGFKVVAIHKYLSSPPEYLLRTNTTEIHLGEVNVLLSQTQFAHKVAAACGVAIQSFPAPQWQMLKQRLLDACEEVEIGEEAREDGMLSQYINEFLRLFKPSAFKDRAAMGEMPYVENNTVFLFGSKLRIWIKMNYMTDITPKRMGMLMKQLGCSPVVANINLGDRRTTKAVWKLAEKYNGAIPEKQ